MSDETPSKLQGKDCFECRLTGFISCLAIGAYVLYQSTSSYYLKRPYVKFAVRSLSAAFIYGGLARWFYLPPFHSLKGPQPVANSESTSLNK